jgi:hypothetical protein
MSITFHEDGALPKNGEVFVFGSNYPRGVHGAGAARAALQFGAVMGKGVGPVGNTYAIPTKDRNIHTMPLKDIVPYISKFLSYAKTNADKTFYLTRIGCGLAGYSDHQIAPLFNPPLPNINYPDTWKTYLHHGTSSPF